MSKDSQCYKKETTVIPKYQNTTSERSFKATLIKGPCMAAYVRINSMSFKMLNALKQSKKDHSEITGESKEKCNVDFELFR